MDTGLFHTLEGENIYFKSLSTEDAEEIHSFAANTDVSRLIGWKLMQDIDETRRYTDEMLRREAAGTHLYASIVLKSTEKIIGTAMMFNFDEQAKHAEIGYVLNKNYWGQGYGTESVGLMKDFAFGALNFHKLHARVVDINIGSTIVLERSGFELEGRLKDYYFIEDIYYAGLFYGKIRDM